ncbi:hypothetical protein BT93_K0785 [Corymbia citriodora subsp. variegata]|nr:hypothetical protein BT93_K0785 [Corymbia citriodora subsp. variegata]
METQSLSLYFPRNSNGRPDKFATAHLVFKCPSPPPRIFDDNWVFATGDSRSKGSCNSPSHPPELLLRALKERSKNRELLVMGKTVCYACDDSSEFPGLLLALVIAVALMLTCYSTPRRRPLIVYRY